MQEFGFWEVPGIAATPHAAAALAAQQAQASPATDTEHCLDPKPCATPLSPGAQLLGSRSSSGSALSAIGSSGALSAAASSCALLASGSSRAFSTQEETGEASHLAGSTGSESQGAPPDISAGVPADGGGGPSAAPPPKRTWSAGWFNRGGEESQASADGAAQREKAAAGRALLPAPFSRQRAEDDNLRLSVTICEYMA